MPATTAEESSDAPQRPAGGLADRLWPVLLDRLTDLEPQRRKEAPQARTLSRKAYRESVLRDLQWLLNTTNLDASMDFAGHRDAQNSVINFGLGALSGQFASDVDVAQLEAMIRQAIVEFEPRLLPRTVEVSLVMPEHVLDVHNVLGVTIRAELWSVPYPLDMLLRSDIDLETGHVVLHDQTGGE
jgi:type VI secretion system protein ImpF